MDRKLGRVMSSSRMITFIAFLAATFAWVLSMPALFTVSLIALVASGALYLNDKRKSEKKSA
jgi:flagellar biosynthesis component FlhA